MRLSPGARRVTAIFAASAALAVGQRVRPFQTGRNFHDAGHNHDDGTYDDDYSSGTCLPADRHARARWGHPAAGRCRRQGGEPAGGPTSVGPRLG